MILQGLCDSFMVEVFNGEHSFTTDTFKMAFYGPDATLGTGTTAYSTDNELVGGTYPAGGYEVTMPEMTLAGGVASCTPVLPAPTGAISGSVRGAVIYNSSHSSNASVMVLDFGETLTLTNESISITFLPIGLNGFMTAANTSMR